MKENIFKWRTSKSGAWIQDFESIFSNLLEVYKSISDNVFTQSRKYHLPYVESVTLIKEARYSAQVKICVEKILNFNQIMDFFEVDTRTFQMSWDLLATAFELHAFNLLFMLDKDLEAILSA